MKKTVSLLLAAILLLGLCACGAVPAKPEDTVIAFSEGMKAYDFEKMQSCLASSEEDLQSELFNGEDQNDLTAKFLTKMKAWAKDMTYEIVSTETDGAKATVEVKYSYKDTTAIVQEFFTEYVTRALALALSGATEEEVSELAEQILADKMDTVEPGGTECNIVYALTKKDNKWLIDELPEDVLRVMTADFMIALEEVAATLNG